MVHIWRNITKRLGTNTQFPTPGVSHIVETTVNDATRQNTSSSHAEHKKKSISSVGETPLSSSMCGQHTSCLTQGIRRRSWSTLRRQPVVRAATASGCPACTHGGLHVAETFNKDPCHQHFPNRQTWKKIFDHRAWHLRLGTASAARLHTTTASNGSRHAVRRTI